MRPPTEGKDIKDDFRAMRRYMLTVITLLILVSGILAIGWNNAEKDKSDLRTQRNILQAEKDKILMLYTRVADLAEDAEVRVRSITKALANESQRAILLGPRAILDDLR